jgi:TonB family protein
MSVAVATRGDDVDGENAVEVISLFEDTVLDVQHLRAPGAPGASVRARTVMIAGAAALAAAVAVFVGLALGAGAGADRLVDAAVFALLVTGVGALVVGQERRARSRAAHAFTLGAAPGTSFSVPDDELPERPFALVRREAGQWRVQVAAAMRGDVTAGGARRPLDELRAAGVARAAGPGLHSFPILEGARIKIEFGDNTFLISSVRTPAPLPNPIRIDWRQESFTAATALVLAGALLAMQLVPPEPSSLALDRWERDRIVHFLNKPPQDDTPPPKDASGGGPAAASTPGRKAAGPPGAIGRRDARSRDGRLAVAGAPSIDRQVARQTAEAAAQRAGILPLLRGLEGTHAGSNFGRDSAIGSDALTALDGLTSGAEGEARGTDGLGTFGPHHGGGGTADGTIGIGDWGAFRPGGPGGPGHGPGWGSGPAARLPGRRPTEIVGAPPPVRVIGSLDKSIIRRVIRSHLNEVRFCYEKELMRAAALAGRITVRFTIGANGAVATSGVEASTLGNVAVERCVTDAVRRWEFPRPEGGVVMVSYPFLLKAAGAD